LGDETTGWEKYLDDPEEMIQGFRNGDYNAAIDFRMQSSDGIVIVGTIDFGGNDPTV
jgi:hypothetical protein